MNKKDDILKELQEISPLLSKKLKEREGGFEVPDGFFDSFADTILDQVKEASNEAIVTPINKATSSNSPFKWVSLAASILLLVVAGFWMMNQNTSTSSWAKLEQMNAKEVLQYLDENMDDLELDDLMDSGIVSADEFGIEDHSNLSEEEKDIYLDVLLDEISEEI